MAKRIIQAKVSSPSTSIPEAVIPAKIVREKVDPSKFVSLYVNDLQVQITPWDFRFILGLVTETPTKEEPTIKISTIGEIRMAPQLAKRLAIVLAGQLKGYEESVGTVPLPEPD